MTPPAFITMGTNGLWVGKFETGYKGATTTASAQVNSSDSTKVQIKPNVYSWRNIQPSNAHLASYNYQRDLDSHMMKNTEWGAVAYLQHSKYGSSKGIVMNNNIGRITGYVAKVEPTCTYTNLQDACNKAEETLIGVDGINTLNYKNQASGAASTTGNHTGIYDMNGGWQYLMGVMLDSTNSVPLIGQNTTYHSGFNGALSEVGTFTSGINLPNEKYFDIYKHSMVSTTYQRRILGDGTAEFGPHANVTYGGLTRQVGSWYDNDAYLPYNTYTWVLRKSIQGIFLANGEQYIGNSFRIVLAI